MLVNDTAIACIGRFCYRRKRCFSRFPPKRMCVEARGRPKGNIISRNVVRLDDIAYVGIIKLSPTTKLNIQLVPGALCASAVPGD